MTTKHRGTREFLHHTDVYIDDMSKLSFQFNARSNYSISQIVAETSTGTLGPKYRGGHPVPATNYNVPTQQSTGKYRDAKD